MRYLVDGSNVLGRSGNNREDGEAKRALLREISKFAGSRGATVELFFDGPAEPAFATSLGKVTVRFSGSRSADDLIVDALNSKAARGRNHLVTDDRVLLNRAAGRDVQPVPVVDFLRSLQAAVTSAEGTQREVVDDWESYFSDPKNKTQF